MKKLLQQKLAWGVVVIVMTQILGMLPALDFLPQIWLKLVSFTLGVLLTIAKGIEMFYEQTAQLESTTEETQVQQSAAGTITNTSRTSTTQTDAPKQ